MLSIYTNTDIDDNKYIILTKSSLKLFCVIIFSLFTKDTNTKNYKDLLNYIYNFMGGQHLMTNLLTAPIQEFKDSYTTFFNSLITREPVVTDNDEIFLDLYHKKDPSVVIHDKVRPFINRRIEYYTKISKSKTVVHGRDFTDARKNMNMYYSSMNKLCILENQERTVDFNIYIDKLDSAFFAYENKTELINKIIKPFIYNMYNTNKRVNVIPLFLVGEPGTGKTKFVTDLSNILDVPICKHTDFIGKVGMGESDSFYITDEVDSCKFNIKTIRDAYIENMLQKKSRNLIFFVDEMDKKMNDSRLIYFLLDILGQSKPIKNSFFQGLEISMPNILFIMAGNNKISEISKQKSTNTCYNVIDMDMDIDEMPMHYKQNNNSKSIESIESRIIYIEFPKMQLETKNMIVYKFLKDSLDDSLYQTIDTKYIDDLINNDTNGGVRNLLLQMSIYINTIRNKQFYTGTKWDNV